MDTEKVIEKVESFAKDELVKVEKKSLLDNPQVNTNMFMNFIAAICLLFTFVYISLITFLKVPEENQRYADTILGFLAGTLITTIINFYFGSSKSSKDKDILLNNQTTTTSQQVEGTK